MSCTGTGEVFIRTAAAYDVSARLRYCPYPAQPNEHADESSTAAKVHKSKPCNNAVCAMTDVLNQIDVLGGSGGIIAVCANGDHALAFNTEGMYRGLVGSDIPLQTGVYEDE